MYEIFARLLKEKGLTAYKVSKDTGIPNTTLSAWKRGVCNIKNDKLQIIADYLNVSLPYLLGITDDPQDYIETVEEAQKRLQESIARAEMYEQKAIEARQEAERLEREAEKLKATQEALIASNEAFKNKDFKQAVERLKNLTPEQLQLLNAILNQFENK